MAQQEPFLCRAHLQRGGQGDPHKRPCKELHPVKDGRVDLHSVGGVSNPQQPAMLPGSLIGRGCRVQEWVIQGWPGVQRHSDRDRAVSLGRRRRWPTLLPLLPPVWLRRHRSLLQPAQRSLQQLIFGPAGQQQLRRLLRCLWHQLLPVPLRDSTAPASLLSIACMVGRRQRISLTCQGCAACWPLGGQWSCWARLAAT